MARVAGAVQHLHRPLPAQRDATDHVCNLAEFTARFNRSENPLTNRSFLHSGCSMSCRMAWVNQLRG
jgi:hypothetical protein